MSAPGRSLVYESGQWQVHLGRRELRASGVAVPIGAHAFEIIEVLVRSANELASKNDLVLLRAALADIKLSYLHTGAAVETDDR